MVNKVLAQFAGFLLTTETVENEKVRYRNCNN
jgi:hypothetical protein